MKILTDDLENLKTINSQSTDKLNFSFKAITLFPEMFSAVTDYGVVGRAVKSDLVELDCINPREFTQDKHRTVDDRPYGGGPGMLMKVEPLDKAVKFAKNQCRDSGSNVKVIYLSPQGQKLNQSLVRELAQEQELILLCGRYEGVDQRLIEQLVDMEISVGDFVLSGGELAAMSLIDAVTRVLPSVLGHEESAEADSFEDGLLDHPHYTRPESYQGKVVPPVLLGGDHKKIALWRLKQRLGNTWLKRPDLLEKKNLSESELKLLDDFKNERSD
ncbi:MAG: tRNA (guanosine(37)-N1)-methyltransferase TrmD [Kangiellaceae bacterium]|jgi:tRNA (guanine37-N1)-methyltransferase